MTYKKGTIARSSNVRYANGRRLINKIRSSLDKAVDGLGTASKEGATVMAELITEALREDVVGTLKGLASYLPKDVKIDINHSDQLNNLTDDELADIIASRARGRLMSEKQVKGEIIVDSEDKAKS